jgi:predicted RNA-binding protein
MAYVEPLGKNKNMKELKSYILRVKLTTYMVVVLEHHINFDPKKAA